MGSTIRRNVITISALLGAIIWVLDGFLDYFFFFEGSFLGLVFTNIPPHELYIRLFWFVGLLIIGAFASLIINEREKALDEKEELESHLRAVRNVNQLLVRADDRGKIIEGVCNDLMEARGYEHVWVALWDESNNLIRAAQKGLGEEFDQLLDRIQRGQLPTCVEKILNNSSVTVTENPSITCDDCPLSETYNENGGIHISLEYNGNVYGVLSASAPTTILDDNEEQELFIEVAGDIAFALHQIEVEKELRKSRERFRSYVENAPVGVFVVDGKGNYVEVNQAACELTGYSEEELLGMNAAALHPPEATEKAMEAFERLVSEGEMEIELPYLRKGKGGTEGHMVINAVKISEDRYLGFTLDVTDRKEAERKLEKATLGTLQALNRTIEAKDEYTGEHIDRVQNLSVKVGEKLELSEERLEQIRYASILHDIGKIGVSDSILGKPAELTEEEWKEMEKHPKVGERIVGQVDQLTRAARIIGEHQEHYDGSGYPRGLEGEEITLEARIVSVADAWDAMRTDRPYREALPRDEAIKELKENMGTQFDPEIVEITLDLLEKEGTE